MGISEVRSPGRPRDQGVREKVLEAALSLAGEQGARSFSMEGIAKHTGVSKETLYRWWRSKSEVLLEALVHYGEVVIPLPDTGSLETDLLLFMRATAKALDPTTRQLLRGLATGAASDSSFAALVRDRFVIHRRQALAAILDRSGQVSPATVDTILDLVFGSLWYRLIFDIGPLNRSWADAVTDTIVHAVTELPI